MILFPAIDLMSGQVVRLKQGQADQSTVFSKDPSSMAQQWLETGTEFLHVIDLDAAMGNAPNVDAIRAMAKLPLKIQLGGGVRDEITAKFWLDQGIHRLIIGTMALEEPQRFLELCRAYPGQIGVSLDAVKGKLKTRGWLAESSLTVLDILPHLTEAAFVIYTDIERDGMQQGVNLASIAPIAKACPVPFIVAGGVTNLADVQALYPLSLESNFQGAITGRAIYEGTLNLQEANAWIKNQKN